MQLNEVTFLNSDGVLIPYERRPDHLMAGAEQLMGIPHAQHDWTAEMVRAIPDDGNRYECVDGELLVTPAPRPAHERAIRALYDRLTPYLRGSAFEIFLSRGDVEFDKRSRVEPDVFVVPILGSQLAERWKDMPLPVLAIEVLSPSSARHDRWTKRRRYQRAGVPEFWIVDLDARLVERWRPEDERPELLNETIIWQPVPDRPPLAIDLLAVFAEATA